MLRIFCLVMALAMPLPASAFEKVDNVVPIPPAEQALQTAHATSIKLVGNEGQVLEGAIFAPNGDLLFCDVTGRRVLRLKPDGALETVIRLADLNPGGLALAEDGTLYICASSLDKGIGAILALPPNGKELKTILPTTAGFMVNDMALDGNGGFYFSDFRGSATKPDGGIYYMAPDLSTITPVIPNLGQANGVALSPDGKILWATEYARNLLHRVVLSGPAKSPHTGSKIPYHFIGAGPDSMRLDSEGNVYVAMMGQGRVLIFNENGIPIGQILLPGREKGQNLRSASVAVHPDKNETRIVAGNFPEYGSREATVFQGPAFAPAKKGAAQ